MELTNVHGMGGVGGRTKEGGKGERKASLALFPLPLVSPSPMHFLRFVFFRLVQFSIRLSRKAKNGNFGGRGHWKSPYANVKNFNVLLVCNEG